VKPLCPGGGSQVAASLGTAAIERRDGGNRFLMGLKNAWEDHQLCLGMMRDVLMYLVRFRVPTASFLANWIARTGYIV